MADFKIYLLNFDDLRAKFIHHFSRFLAKFALRAPCRAGRLIRNLRAKFARALNFRFQFASILNFTQRRLRGDLLYKFQKRSPLRALKFHGQALQAEFYRILKSVNFAAKFHKISKDAKFRCAPLCLRRLLIRVLRAKSLNSRRASRPFLNARSVNLCAELFALVDFPIRKFALRAFDFSPLSIRNLRARFTAARALPHSIPPRAFTLFLHLSTPIFDFFPRAPRV